MESLARGCCLMVRNSLGTRGILVMPPMSIVEGAGANQQQSLVASDATWHHNKHWFSRPRNTDVLSEIFHDDLEEARLQQADAVQQVVGGRHGWRQTPQAILFGCLTWLVTVRNL